MLPEDAARLADDLIRAHLPGRGWTFAFDRAVRRAGACDHQRKRVTLSRHLVAGGDEAEVRQVLLHEIAHALAGHAAGHGAKWRAVAVRIGAGPSRLHDRPIAEERATWVGRCPAGHEHRRFRRPQRAVSCGVCAPRFSRRALIEWTRAAPGQSVTRTSFQNAT